MIVIGLTGSIGMGKSTCGKMLQELGVPVHESDYVVHALLSNDIETQNEIIKEFPNLSLPIDRKSLGQIIFNDDEKRKILENILHPRVKDSQQLFINEQSQNKHDIVALDIPLLYETGADKRVDYVMVVSANSEIQKERVLSRPNMSVEKFQAILDSQMCDSEKCKRADFVISTDYDQKETISQIEIMLKTIKKEHT